MVERVASILGGNREGSIPTGTIHVVDPSPLNWLYINYHVVEGLVRVRSDGYIVPAAMSSYTWVDNLTLEITVRDDNQFPTSKPLTVETVKQSFDELMRWKAPHPPGTQFNFLPDTRCEVFDDGTVRFHLSKPDGLMVGKLRAMHIMDARFWEEIGYGYARFGTGEGHW